MTDLSGLRVAALVATGVEEQELSMPVEAIRVSGAAVDILAPRLEDFETMRRLRRGRRMQPDHSIGDVRASDYHALLIPGGLFALDELRLSPAALSLICEMQWAWKPIGAIGHGISLLVSAALVRGRNLTGPESVSFDIENAGGVWADADVVIDYNLVTCRGLHDVIAFNRAFLRLLNEAKWRTGEDEPMISSETRALFSKSRIA